MNKFKKKSQKLMSLLICRLLGQSIQHFSFQSDVKAARNKNDKQIQIKLEIINVWSHITVSSNLLTSAITTNSIRSFVWHTWASGSCSRGDDSPSNKRRKLFDYSIMHRYWACGAEKNFSSERRHSSTTYSTQHRHIHTHTHTHRKR